MIGLQNGKKNGMVMWRIEKLAKIGLTMTVSVYKWVTYNYNIPKMS